MSAPRLRAMPAGLRVAAFWVLLGVMFAGLGALPLAGPWGRFFFGVLATAGGIGITLGFLALGDASPATVGMAFRRSSVGRGLAGIAMGAALASIHFGLIHAFAAGMSLERSPDVGLEMLALFAVSYLGLSAMEEVAFRGYPLRSLHGRYGLWPAQAVVALAFALYHVAAGQDVLGALLGTGMGSLLFGMAALATRGLAIPIGLHAAWNYLAWIVGEKPDAGPWRILIEDESIDRVRVVGSISYFLVLGAATLGFWLWHRRAPMSRSRRSA